MNVPPLSQGASTSDRKYSVGRCATLPGAAKDRTATFTTTAGTAFSVVRCRTLDLKPPQTAAMSGCSNVATPAHTHTPLSLVEAASKEYLSQFHDTHRPKSARAHLHRSKQAPTPTACGSPAAQTSSPLHTSATHGCLRWPHGPRRRHAATVSPIYTVTQGIQDCPKWPHEPADPSPMTAATTPISRTLPSPPPARPALPVSLCCLQPPTPLYTRRTKLPEPSQSATPCEAAPPRRSCSSPRRPATWRARCPRPAADASGTSRASTP